jgi:RND family efflux transporter MFP subunit
VKQERGETPETVRLVRTVTVYPAPGTEHRQLAATVSARSELPVSFRVGGRVADVNADIGNRVNRGDILARLESTEFQLEVDRGRAALESATAQSDAAEAAYQRIRALFRNDSASRGQLESARASFESSRAALESARVQLDSAQFQLAYTELTAPITGVVAKRSIEPGMVIPPGQAAFHLSSVTVNRVRFSVGEMLVGRLPVGTVVKVTIDALGLNQLDAEITEVSGGSSQQGALFPVTATIRGPVPPGIRAGMSAAVSVDLPVHGGERYIVPSHAVQEDWNGRFVFVVIPNDDSSEQDDLSVSTSHTMGTVKRKPVSVAGVTRDGVVIAHGISPGDQVITAGVSRVSEGMTVRFLPDERSVDR